VNNSVCAVITTYNRKKLLIECLESLRKQTRPIQGICLIDNGSTDGTPELLLEKNYINELPPNKTEGIWERDFEIKNLVNGEPIKFHFIKAYKNKGASGGFSEVIKRGYEKGYNWLWIMDDDAEPEADALEILIPYSKNDYIVGLAGSVILPNNNSISIFHRGRINLRKRIFPMIQIPISLEEYKNDILEIDFASFVGLLLKREAIEKIGLPKNEFFMLHDDVEYSIRLRNAGKILLVTKSIIYHKEGLKSEIRVSKKNFLGKQYYSVNLEHLKRTYYSIRNLTWLGKTYSESRIKFYLQLIGDFIKKIIKIILFDDHKFKRIKLLLNAYVDGLIGNFDNEKPKKILSK